MSKVSKLKQEAYEAGKKRDWGRVVALYERILELDKNNPTLINELGDAHLKQGDIPHAIEHFLTAAEKYRATGLLNNAVAIHKKILRFDPGNLSAHWFLAELRGAQGLPAEGAGHALQFLAAGEHVGDAFREPYTKRCVKLLAIYPTQEGVLERLRELFRRWGLSLEEARVGCLLACLMRGRGEDERAKAQIDALLEARPELVNYPEHAVWQQRNAPVPEVAGAPVETSFADVNTLELAPKVAARHERPPAAAPQPVADTSLAHSLGLVDFDFHTESPRQASASALGESARAEEALTIQRDEPSFLGLNEALREAEPAGAEEKPIDLLAEILAEDSGAPAVAAAGQVDTIVMEIEQQVGGAAAAQDPASRYNMGLVYLEMELYEPATDCFASTALVPEYALQSYEMWGIALIRQERFEEAVDVLSRGLRVPDAEPTQLLGLLYHTGLAYERAQRAGAAREYYERVYQLAPQFLDVEKRLEELESA